MPTLSTVAAESHGVVGNPAVPLGHRSAWSESDGEIEAAAPCLSMLFDESGMALAELASAEDAGAPVSCWEPVDIKAPDLGGLACSWFNELMRDAGVHRAELVDVAVDAVMLPADGGGDACRLQGRVGLRRLFGHRGPARYDLRTTKEAVSVDLTDGIWSLRAHLGPREDPSCLDGLQRADATDPSQPVRSLGDSDTGHRT